MASTTHALAGEIVSRIQPCMDQVLIEKLVDEKSKGGIILVQQKTNSLPTERGRVLAVGPGKWDNGKFVETTLRKGSEVLFHSFPSGVEVRENAKEYTLVAERQIVAVLGMVAE